jgi:DNA-binding LacI/PurR family transcriptional regulator
MDELGYRPHIHARALASKRSRIIALLCPPTRRGLGETELEYVTSAVEAARGLDYHLVLWTSEYDDRRELLHLVRQGLVDGMIVMEVHEKDPRIDVLRETQIPFTMIGRNKDASLSSWADIDFDRTFREAAEYLAKLGHRRIGFLNQSREVFEQGYGPALRAHEAFDKACVEYGITGRQRFCPAAPKDGFAALEALLDADPRITAVQVMNDRALPGVLQAAAVRGLRVGEDLSVVAMVSSARAAESCLPALTALEAPGSQLARIGVERLVELIEGRGSDLPGLLVPCDLVVRSSTGPRREDIQ